MEKDPFSVTIEGKEIVDEVTGEVDEVNKKAEHFKIITSDLSQVPPCYLHHLSPPHSPQQSPQAEEAMEEDKEKRMTLLMKMKWRI